VFSSQDGPDAARVIVVSQAFVERFWPGQDPIGRVIRFPGDPKPATIIGVVGDIKQWQLEEQQLGQIYTHYPQNPHIFATLAVRTDGDPMTMVGAVRQAVWSVDRDQPMWKVRTLESLLRRATGQRRFTAILLGSFSGLALLLAAIGLYGVISYSVAQRTQEVGVRMALGAQRRNVFGLILGKGMLLTGVGLALGVVGAYFATRLLTTLLFQTKPGDPLTFLVVAGVLTLVALLASYLPARRAMGVDPVVALRYE
jgi:predicted permease